MTNTSLVPRSVLATLRGLIPSRQVHEFYEAKKIAELQATRLLELHHITTGPVPVELIGELPKIHIELSDMPVSGASFWDSRACQWVIQLNRYESPRRQRFTLAHEYKHIIDHGRSSGLYSGTATNTPAEQAEQAADYFAGCLLVPKVLLKRAYYGGMQQVADLARHFDVSEAAITCRLSQTGIVTRSDRFRPDRRAFPGTFRYRMKPELQLQGV